MRQLGLRRVFKFNEPQKCDVASYAARSTEARPRRPRGLLASENGRFDEALRPRPLHADSDNTVETSHAGHLLNASRPGSVMSAVLVMSDVLGSAVEPAVGVA
jgi:hypothetical protein